MEGGERGDDRNAQYIPLAVKKISDIEELF